MSYKYPSIDITDYWGNPLRPDRLSQYRYTPSLIYRFSDTCVNNWVEKERRWRLEEVGVPRCVIPCGDDCICWDRRNSFNDDGCNVIKKKYFLKWIKKTATLIRLHTTRPPRWYTIKKSIPECMEQMRGQQGCICGGKCAYKLKYRRLWSKFYWYSRCVGCLMLAYKAVKKG